MDVKTAQVMEDANAVIEKLQNQVGVERFEDIMEKHRELEEDKAEIQRLMGEFGVNEDDIDNEIELLEAELAEEEMGEVPKGKIKSREVSR
jgi:uncharacterized protein Smg (DUF494 family)